MNAKEKTNTTKDSAALDFSLISLEKATPISLWQRFKKYFSVPEELTVRDWERLESKPFRKRCEENQWRNF